MNAISSAVGNDNSLYYAPKTEVKPTGMDPVSSDAVQAPEEIAKGITPVENDFNNLAMSGSGYNASAYMQTLGMEGDLVGQKLNAVA